jgi:glucosylceramidase
MKSIFEKNSAFKYLLITGLISLLFACNKEDNTMMTTEILVTSENGDLMASKNNVSFVDGDPSGTVINVYPNSTKQTILGIGTSFTESSAFVLAHLDEDKRKEVMRNIFSADGANFSIARTHIGACDFSVEGKYSYADQKDDIKLESFDIFQDKNGFSKDNYPGIENEKYDLLPMIKEALEIKANKTGSELNIVASAWTAPKWMKDIEEWYIPGSPENNWQGTGGSLKEEYESLYADYLVKYLESYSNEGINIWGLTPVNEPHGNNGQWESMHFTAESQRDFIKEYLGPKLKESEFNNTKLLFYDQNREGIEHWSNTILSDEDARKYVYGIAVHWYESTYKVFEENFDRYKEKYPEYSIIHTEGCIDDLGKDAPPGIMDTENFKEKNWFNNDEFWWNKNATDWAYTAEWAPNREDHPIYTPVHRYARNIIVSIDHWLEGWIDWNIVLDKNGGPNHVGNFCGAPIMIDTEKGLVYYTPIFHVLKQFSRTIRPGDKALKTDKKLDSSLDSDDLHACATINDDNIVSIQVLNTTKEAIKYNLKLDNRFAEIEIPANSLQTVRFKINNN